MSEKCGVQRGCAIRSSNGVGCPDELSEGLLEFFDFWALGEHAGG